MSRRYKSKTVAELKAVAKEYGFRQLAGAKRDEVLEALANFDRSGVVPLRFRKKQKVGQGCEKNEECTTKNCEDGQCAKGLVPRIKRLRPLIEENPDVPAEDRRKKECYKMKNVEIKEHQQRVARFLRKEDTKGLIVFHSVGSGKTLTSIAAAKCCVAVRPDLRVIILAPSSVAMQFKKEIMRAGLSRELASKLNVYSHKTWLDRYKAGLVDARNTMLIVDEAHAFRKHIGTFKKKDEGDGDEMLDDTEELGGSYAETLHKACMEASKVMLLTATPLVNSSKDMRNYIAMITQTPLKKEYNRFGAQNHKQLLSHLKCKFSYFKSNDRTLYPAMTEYIEEIEMPNTFQKTYEEIEEQLINDKDAREMFANRFGDLKHFYNGIRRAINKVKLETPKVDWIVNKVQEEVNKKRKIVVYSTWKSFGVNLIKEYLEDLNIKYASITGDVSKDKRLKEVEKYNEDKVKVLIISGAGSEGLDLKNTRTLVVMEPFWNLARIKQVVGRAVRYMSHEALPPKERTVDVHHLVVIKNKKIARSAFPSADQLLLDMSRTKAEEIKETQKAIIKTSIEKNPTCME
jgi:SNF2 family DNA or RNA helicase